MRRESTITDYIFARGGESRRAKGSQRESVGGTTGKKGEPTII